MASADAVVRLQAPPKIQMVPSASCGRHRLAGNARIRDRLPTGLRLGGRLARACDLPLAGVARCRKEVDTADHQQQRYDGGRGGEQQGSAIALLGRVIQVGIGGLRDRPRRVLERCGVGGVGGVGPRGPPGESEVALRLIQSDRSVPVNGIAAVPTFVLALVLVHCWSH